MSRRLVVPIFAFAAAHIGGATAHAQDALPCFVGASGNGPAINVECTTPDISVVSAMAGRGLLDLAGGGQGQGLWGSGRVYSSDLGHDVVNNVDGGLAAAGIDWSLGAKDQISAGFGLGLLDAQGDATSTGGGFSMSTKGLGPIGYIHHRSTWGRSSIDFSIEAAYAWLEVDGEIRSSLGGLAANSSDGGLAIVQASVIYQARLSQDDRFFGGLTGGVYYSDTNYDVPVFMGRAISAVYVGGFLNREVAPDVSLVGFLALEAPLDGFDFGTNLSTVIAPASSPNLLIKYQAGVQWRLNKDLNFTAMINGAQGEDYQDVGLGVRLSYNINLLN